MIQPPTSYDNILPALLSRDKRRGSEEGQNSPCARWRRNHTYLPAVRLMIRTHRREFASFPHVRVGTRFHRVLDVVLELRKEVEPSALLNVIDLDQEFRQRLILVRQVKL